MSKWQKHYHTPRGYLLTRHRDMRKRVAGKPAGDGKSRIWLGMECCDRDEFYEFAINDPVFNELWEQWEANDFARSYAPSVHRIRRDEGYRLDNITFKTHREKSALSLGWKDS